MPGGPGPEGCAEPHLSTPLTAPPWPLDQAVGPWIKWGTLCWLLGFAAKRLNTPTWAKPFLPSDWAPPDTHS